MTTRSSQSKAEANLTTPTLLLDLDGTLIDSLKTVQDTLLYAVDFMGKERPSDDFLSTIAGPPMRVSMARLGWSQEEIEEAMPRYIEHYDTEMWHRAPLYPGIAEQVKNLAELGYRLMIATSKRQSVAEKTLRHVGIAHYMDFIGGAGDDGKTRQAKKDVIAYVLENAGDDPSQPAGNYLMVGDRIHDVEGAASFGIDTLLCEWGTGTPEEWEQAAHLVKTTDDLTAAITAILPPLAIAKDL